MRRLAALCAAAIVLVVFGIGQLVLPGIAAQSLRDRLQRSGQVLAVHVDAFPAVELLWHQADSIVVKLGRYRSSPSNLAGLLDQARNVDSVTASAAELDTGLLTLRDATLHKRGSELTGNAQVTEADLRAALPALQSVTPVASGNGRLTVRGTATLFGVTASVDVTVSARDGSLVAVPDVPFGALATIRIFSDPRLDVLSIGASPTAAGFSVTALARLR
jgi:LmeA-like phospholipid-binding